MIERDEAGEFVRIKCDMCGRPAPSSADMIVNRGLNNMGWKCTGGSHKCATCVETARALSDD